MTEHAAGIFVFFFLAEYASIILICILIAIIFIGGYEILGYICNIQEFIIIITYNLFIFVIYILNSAILLFNYIIDNNFSLYIIYNNDYINYFLFSIIKVFPFIVLVNVLALIYLSVNIIRSGL